jgi:hypothetical protein
MTFLPRGPVPPSVPLAIAVVVVMLIGFALDAVSLVGLLVVCVAVLGYVLFTLRAGTSGGSAQ